MIGDGQLGQFDPAHCDDPSLPCRVWRAHSVVDVSVYGLGAISTRRVTDLERARVEKSLWWPKLYTFIGTGDFCGAGAYSAGSWGSGICLSNLSLAQSPMFQIIHTGVQVG